MNSKSKDLWKLNFLSDLLMIVIYGKNDWTELTVRSLHLTVNVPMFCCRNTNDLSEGTLKPWGVEDLTIRLASPGCGGLVVWVCKNNGIPQLNRGCNHAGSSPALGKDNRAQQEDKDSSGKDSANEKPWTLVNYSPPQLPFPFYKSVLLSHHVGTCTWLPMVADTSLQFTKDPR